MTINTMIYLIGFPGVGKYTTAKLLCEYTGAKLVDNHLINNPIFSIVDRGGATPIPWERIKAIRDIMFDTIREVSPKTFSFVLTNVLYDDDEDFELFSQVQQMAVARESLFVPVMLSCSEDELCRRVVSLARRDRMKITSPEKALKILREKRPMPLSHPHTLHLDTTHTQPRANVQAIIRHIETLAGGADVSSPPGV